MDRRTAIKNLLAEEPAYRLKQISQALFNPKIKSWEGVTALSKAQRQELASMPFYVFNDSKVLASKFDGAYKVVLTLLDGKKIETVLIPNARDAWTVCLSTQIGCARRCIFCATGTMGLARNLTADEIVDQYRFWTEFLIKEGRADERITNLVLMGMGEPLDNYENVKIALNDFLSYTEIGFTHVTVSTVGVWPAMDKLLIDKDWPPVRLAISLHSAIQFTRQKIVPATTSRFLEQLTVWAKKYLVDFGNRRHHLTFEYVMLAGINDSVGQAEALVKLVKKIKEVRVNLVPFNPAPGGLKKSSDQAIDTFQKYLKSQSINTTLRRSLGTDIMAACGQLVAKK